MLPAIKPSTKVEMMLVEAKNALVDAGKAVVAAYNQAISEGFSPPEAKKLILSRTNFKERTV